MNLHLATPKTPVHFAPLFYDPFKTREKCHFKSKTIKMHMAWRVGGEGVKGTILPHENREI